ncbi:hypothetical protein [Archaeoglobus profundus]|uniref:Uncharacterized protein n=1 Tax=Archaeoglobus profundus (strain DSM 5631 / JCM 9629 / NBRC 100127 / Av18) TaxID=572546 RepID=D2REF0_ARCPA|nr:hypothetical protein [Archaeoglobus profundus]ADB58494.1 hypothetical protein Arcpr_1446 [Archaeoglobus profundus DSM 5631]
MLEDVEKVLKENGFRCFLKGDELVVPFKVDAESDIKLVEFLAYRDGRTVGIIYDAGDVLNRVDLLKEILKIPTKFKVSVGLDDDNDLIFEIWSTRLNKSVESFLGAFFLFTKFVGWLKNQLKREFVKSFELDEQE